MPMIAWILGLGISVGALVIAAAAHMHLLHAALSCAVALAIALSATMELNAAEEAGMPPNGRAALAARHMGLIWAWGALVLLVTYLFVLAWREWWHFAVAFMLAALICFFFASALSGERATARDDESLVSLSRYLAMGQLAGTVITIAGLLLFDGRGFAIGGKMLRYLDPRHTDWAANNVFLFGAVALAAISWQALKTSRRPD